MKTVERRQHRVDGLMSRWTLACVIWNVCVRLCMGDMCLCVRGGRNVVCRMADGLLMRVLYASCARNGQLKITYRM